MSAGSDKKKHLISIFGQMRFTNMTSYVRRKNPLLVYTVGSTQEM